MRLKGKVAAITGAGRGIGRAAAEVFAREGARVALLEIDEKVGMETEKLILRDCGQAKWIKVDIAVPDSVRSAFSEIEQIFGGLHVLYNNASIFLGKQDGPVSELSLETWQKILAVNLCGLFYCCKYGLPLMIRSGGGSVINTASSGKKVRANCIAPAAIWTDMLRESSLDKADFDEQGFLKTAPLGRYGKPDEVANIALFLASDESSYLNGAIIVADGGITIT